MSAGAQENLPRSAVTGPGTMPQAVITRRGEGPRRFRSMGVNAVFIALLALISFISVYPFIWLISASFKTKADVFDNRLIPKDWSWNYTGPNEPIPAPQYLFNVAPIETWFMNSVWISVLGALLVTFSSAIVAFAFAYFRFPGRNALFALILATMMLPGAVTMIPVYLIWNEIGQFTTQHSFLPHIGVNTQYPLWVPNLFGSAFYIFLQRQFFLGIPRELFEAARIDGDTYWTMFRRIALPLAKPALIVTFIFEFQAKWFDFMTPLIYLRDSALFTLPLGLKTVLDQFGLGGGGQADYQVIVAGTVITVLPMIIIFAIFQRYFIEGIATQGRKG